MQTGDRNLKKGRGVLCKARIVRYAFIRDCEGFPKCRLFVLFGVSSSGYYDWLKRGMSPRIMSHQALDKEIVRIFAEHNGRYGYRRITDELHDMGIKSSRERIRGRMRVLGLKAVQKRKYKHTTQTVAITSLWRLIC